MQYVVFSQFSDMLRIAPVILMLNYDRTAVSSFDLIKVFLLLLFFLSDFRSCWYFCLERLGLVLSYARTLVSVRFWGPIKSEMELFQAKSRHVQKSEKNNILQYIFFYF